METNEVYTIENDLSLMEDGIIELQTYGTGIPTDEQDTYELKMSELEDRMENLRETFALLRGADVDTWSDVREVFFDGMEEVRTMIDALKEEYEPVAYRIYYDSIN